MKQIKLYLCLIAFLIGVLSSCQDRVVGNGPVVSDSRSVDSFTAIESSLPGNIFISQDSEQTLRIETNENVLDLVETVVVNGTLQLRLTSNVNLNVRTLNVYISAADYERIRLSGAANLSSDNCLTLDELDLRISGAGNATLCGEANRLTVNISGAGNFGDYNFTVQDVQATISGAGNFRVTAEQTLDVNISGAGSVFYRGNPEISSNISGAGALVNAN